MSEVIFEIKVKVKGIAKTSNIEKSLFFTTFVIKILLTVQGKGMRDLAEQETHVWPLRKQTEEKE